MKIKKTQFKKLYLEGIQDILKVRPIDKELKEKLSYHHFGYADYDFLCYFECSWIRAYEVYKMLPENKKLKILDIGGFFGNFALCLKKIGHDVTIVDIYNCYDGIFDKLIKFLENHEISIKNLDFTNALLEDVTLEKYDIILCLALLEHLPNSPKILMSNIKKSLKKDGIALLEIPNIVYLPNRIKFLLGQSILPPIEIIYKTKGFFTGHYHEYTKKEVETLAFLSGFEIKKIAFYNYSLSSSSISKVLCFPAFIFNCYKEIILAKIKPKS